MRQQRGSRLLELNDVPLDEVPPNGIPLDEVPLDDISLNDVLRWHHAYFVGTYIGIMMRPRLLI